METNAMPEQAITVRPVKIEAVKVKIEGASPLITHKWSEKAKRIMLERQQGGKRSRLRDIRNPEEEFEAARYKMADGNDGIPAVALKAAIVSAADKDLGIPKTRVQKSIFVVPDDGSDLLRIVGPAPVMREDMVRIGMGSGDLRYRPCYWPWAIEPTIQYDTDLMSLEMLANLITRAGFGVGLCEWRPSNGGDYGRFTLRS